MAAKTEFLKQWMQSERLKTVAPSVNRYARRGTPARPEAADSGARAEIAPPPALVPFADMDYWYLANDMSWTIPGSATIIRIPHGFATDFASIPSWFWRWMPPVGRYGLPALAHDWLYWDQRYPRGQADNVFRSALEELGVPGWKKALLYRGVRQFGERYWNENTAEKARGTGRVLKQFPDDARVTWADWRKKPGVFV